MNPKCICSPCRPGQAAFLPKPCCCRCPSDACTWDLPNSAKAPAWERAVLSTPRVGVLTQGLPSAFMAILNRIYPGTLIAAMPGTGAVLTNKPSRGAGHGERRESASALPGPLSPTAPGAWPRAGPAPTPFRYWPEEAERVGRRAGIGGEGRGRGLSSLGNGGGGGAGPAGASRPRSVLRPRGRGGRTRGGGTGAGLPWGSCAAPGEEPLDPRALPGRLEALWCWREEGRPALGAAIPRAQALSRIRGYPNSLHPVCLRPSHAQSRGIWFISGSAQKWALGGKSTEPVRPLPKLFTVYTF